MITNDSNENTINFIVEKDDAGKRLDVFLSEKVEDWSRARLQRLIDDEDVLINKKKTKSSYKLRENDEVEVELVEILSAVFESENIPLDIVYEDEYLAIINKPAGMVVHPGAGNWSGTLANAIAWHFKFDVSESGETENGKRTNENRVGIVHRLDKDTSGLIIVAKNEITHERLADQFRKREVYKSYLALVHGYVRKISGRIEQPIGRDKHNRVKMAVSKNGRNAVSVYKVRKRFEKFTLLDVEIKTGRTHQIRVHTAFINHPVVGDELYNEGRDNTVSDVQIRQAISTLGRFFLHSEKLSFVHPVTKKKMDFTSPLPDELKNLLRLMMSDE